jgi:putative ABC transport system permease protein
MNLIECFHIAVRALGANKLRAGLTMLGMIIGVASVIALMSVGNGATASITSRVEGMGSNLLFISPGATSSAGVKNAAGSAASLTLEDAKAISENIPNIVGVAPESNSFGQLVVGSNNSNSRMTGVTPDYETVRNFKVASGEFITDQNVTARSLVAVLGSNIVNQLYGGEDPIGKNISINRVTFKVVGVLESKGGQAMGNQDDLVLIPLTTLQQRFSNNRSAGGGRSVSQIYVQVANKDVMTAVTESIKDLLRERHKVPFGSEDFTVTSQSDLLSTMTQITGVLTVLLGAIAGISLLVGGIGIMNIMLVSVTERTREIGIRKAVGAKRRDILTQFMMESVVISVVGGLIGLALGFGLAQLVGQVDFGGSKLPAVVSSSSVILAVGVSAFVGIFFGSYPAVRASGLNPIEALRYE